MDSTIYLMLAIGILVIILAVVAVMMKKKYKRPTDYYTLFIIGVTWLPLGMATRNYAFTVIGVVLVGIGLANRDKWKKNHLTWNKMHPDERKITAVVMAVLGIMVLAGILVFLMYR
jgi:hypothetical protein